MTRGSVLLLVPPPIPEPVRARFAESARTAAPEIDIAVTDDADRAVARAADAEVIAAYDVPAPVAAQARRLRWVHAFTAGVDQFMMVPGIADGRIVLTRTVGAHGAMPEHVMALILAFARRLHVSIRNQVAHRWDRVSGIGDEIAGRTLGILGLGQIGQALAVRAAAFGMRIIGTQRSPRPLPAVDRVFPPDRLLEVLHEADYVVVLLPLTAETRGLLGERELRAMKPSGVLINVARGAIVQEPALLAALREGWIAGAGLDALEQEPLPPDHPLYELERVIITPHVAGVAPAYFGRVIAVFCENLRRYVEGAPLLHVVDVARGY
ncbi:MAG TPA: D-2-hydroxyacid dehydrogenase [bacterium]|nr:D-2-hydroxyacid dehydrogenase [bacterium]